MTALQWIVKEAKAQKNKNPTKFKTWKEYIKQASKQYNTGINQSFPKKNKVGAVETLVEVGNEKISLIKNRQEKTGYPVYVNSKGYAPVTLDVYSTKILANKKAKMLANKNGYNIKYSGIMSKVGKLKNKVVNKKAAPKKVAKKKLTRKDYDKRFQADKPGKRTSASGNTYYEYRENRSDKGKLLGIGNVLNKNQEIKRLSQLAKTPLEKRIVSILKYKLQDYDNLKSLIKDVLYSGLQSGIISDLIYYNDTLAFYKRYKKEIDVLLKDIMNESGANSPANIFGKKWDNEDWSVQDTNNRNLLAWFGFEEKTRELADKLGYEI